MELVLPNQEQSNKILKDIAKQNRSKNIKGLAESLKDDKLKESNNKRRQNKEDEWTGTRARRQVMEIPIDLFLALEQKYGSKIFQDKAALKSVLKSDEYLKYYLTVPENTL